MNGDISLETRKKCLLSLLLFNIVLYVGPSQCDKARKNKSHTDWKGRDKLSLFVDTTM